MDGEQTLEGKDEKKLERAWTIDEIRKNSASWTLAGDVGLFNLLNEISHNIISKTHEVENAVDSLVHQTKMASVKVNNIINDFHMLSNLQFVENRVYDEEVQETVPEEKPVVEKTKEQKEAEMLPKIIKAVELGLAVLDQAFDKINVNEISDSDDEDLSSEGRTILEPKDPYEHRPLPFIIGSAEFKNCDFAGLKDLIEEEIESSAGEESSISDESDETSSDEEEPLPADEDKFSNMQNHKFPAQSISDRLSSSDESELFGSEKEENDFASDSSFESKKKEGKNIQRPDIEVKVEEKEVRQNSISSLQSKLNLPQVLPVKQKEKDLFANDDETSDEESPFRRKTSLFASDVKFGEEKDDMFDGDLFGESIKKPEKVPQKAESPKVSHVPNTAPTTAKTKQLDLFANDEDSEDDIFNTLMKTKKPASKGSNTGSQDLSEKAESSSTPSSAPSTKPSGNAFDFVTGGGNADSLFGDESDADDLFSKKKQTKKFDFDSFEDDDDLFGITSNKPAKKPEVKKPSKPTEKKISLFSDSDSFDEMSTQSKPPTEKKISLFEDSDSFEPSSQNKPSTQKSISLFADSTNVNKQSKGLEHSVAVKPSKGVKDSIFGDSESDQENVPAPKQVPNHAAPKSKPEKGLFDDEEDDDDDNIFSQANKKNISKKPVPLDKKPEVSKKQVSVVKKSTDSIFDESLKTDTEPTKSNEKPNTNDLGLFDNVSDEKEEILSAASKENDSKKSLFDDSDNDLFTPKSPQKIKEPVNKPSQPPQPDKIVYVPEKTDELESSVPKSNNSASISAALNIEESGVGFDLPIDSSKTLNVIGKDRVKVAAKRRLPSRRGRLAALESSEQEKVEEPKPEDSEKNTLTAKNELFSEQPPKISPAPTVTSHKAQEKKKMDIMSQLISEVSASKVGKKNVLQNGADEEEEVDIFAEAANRSETKRQSFSFLPPKENSIDSGFLNETKSSEAKSNVTEGDDPENDVFFTEPSFRTFRSSVSRADSVLNMSDDDDDDLFSAIKSNNTIPQAKTDGNDGNDLFDDSDIFADIQKEKYELFPTQLYEDEDDDDIFGSLEPTSSNKSDGATNKNKPVKKVETHKVDAFEDPLTGLLGED